MMKKDIRTCDNCQKHTESSSAYNKGWIMFEGISKYFRIIHKNNEEKTQGRQFEGEYLDFCCLECLKKYFSEMVKTSVVDSKEVEK